MQSVWKSKDRNTERSETAKVVAGLGESLKWKLKIIDSKVVTCKDLRSLEGRMSNIVKI
jgi:hypothetical protein